MPYRMISMEQSWSPAAMFRYLMDNAIASKESLNLSLGVTLTAEQVAALTTLQAASFTAAQIAAFETAIRDSGIAAPLATARSPSGR